MHRPLIAALAFVIACDPLHAQALPEIPRGATVRVWAPEFEVSKRRAEFVAWSDSSLTFVPEDDAARELPYTAVTRLETLQGKDHVAGFFRGAGVGAGLGLLIGLATGSSAASGCEGFLCGLEVFEHMAIGGGAGGLLGGLIGVGAPPDKWVREELPPELGFPEERPDYTNWLIVGGALVLLLASA